MNDGRATIDISDIFDTKTGNMTEEGLELLKRKSNGYISYVRGENPYTFPFRIYPNEFAPSKTFNTNTIVYPKYQLNGQHISEKKTVKKLSLFLTEIGSVQEMGYNYIISRLREKIQGQVTKSGKLAQFGYTVLQLPIEALNIVYPHPDLEVLSRQIGKFEPLPEGEEEEEYEDLDEDEESIPEVDPDLATMELQKEVDEEENEEEKEEEKEEVLAPQKS